MSQTMIWYAIAGVLVALLVAHRICRRYAETSTRRHRHIVEIGPDNEMFYVPGDIRGEDADDEF